MERKVLELLDECIGDPESMKKLFMELIDFEENTHAELGYLINRFNRLLTKLGEKGKLTEGDKSYIDKS